MEELRYMIDGEPCSARQLIKWASALDADYEQAFIKSTSEAARILRGNGSVITDNSDYKPATTPLVERKTDAATAKHPSNQ